MPGATREFFFKLVAQLTGERQEGWHRSLPFSSRPQMCYPNVPSFRVVTSGNAQASVASQCEEK